MRTVHKVDNACYTVFMLSRMEKGLKAAPGDFVSLAEAAAGKGVHMMERRPAVVAADTGRHVQEVL